MKSSIQYHIKRRLQGNVKLHQPIVASTASCALSRFTTLKSGVLVDFSTLAGESGNVVALYRGNVAAWWCDSVLKRVLEQHRRERSPARLGIYARASWKLRAGAGSCVT